MIYIETGSTDVCYNFGLEYYFTVEKPLDGTVFLFWRTTPTLMVGRYQNVLEEVDKAYADARGIRIVRRLSGGGTIYTDLGGWQFTFIEDAREEDIQFQRYLAPVIDALGELGVEAAFNGRNDLTVAGRKISGSAQYRLGGRVVHHGSLLFDTDLEEMAAATTVDPYKIQSKSIKSVRDRVTNIAGHLPVPMDTEDFKARVVRHILGPAGTVYTVTPEDDARIRVIAREKFASWESAYGQGPGFNIQRTGRLSGGSITFHLEVKKGLIRQAAVTGDFFSTLDGDAICRALAGCRYEQAAVREALEQGGVAGAVYRASAGELAKVIAD
ncbi:MAG: lipoate--protein ligase [Oscillospiraceae bacterium]|nr:lipoate--protein ligase [Oscillospiraceae bacterium]